MKNAAILAASFAMTHLVGAVPVNKRDIVYTTTTEDVWETYWSTTTLWVHPSDAAAAPTHSFPGGFFEVPASSSTSSSTPVVPSSSSAPAVQAPVSEAAASTPTASPYVAPVVPTTTTPATTIEPTTTPTPTPTSTYVAPVASSSVAAVPAPVAAVSSSTTGENSGDMTYYDVSVGLGSCGVSGTNSENLVAINAPDMGNGANPNNNPHCGQQINIYYNGNTHTATVFDTCPDCAKGSIDVTNELFLKVAPDGDGRVHDVSWSWA